MKIILIASLIVALACPWTKAQGHVTTEIDLSQAVHAGKRISSHFHIQAIGKWFHFNSFIQDDENLPFEGDEPGGSVMNWIAKLFLWFIYLMLAILALGGTLWSLTAKGFWSWVICLFAAFCYAMLIGRYWDYTYCLILFVVLFSAIRIVVVYTAWGRNRFGSE